MIFNVLHNFPQRRLLVRRVSNSHANEGNITVGWFSGLFGLRLLLATAHIVDNLALARIDSDAVVTNGTVPAVIIGCLYVACRPG